MSDSGFSISRFLPLKEADNPEKAKGRLAGVQLVPRKCLCHGAVQCSGKARFARGKRCSWVRWGWVQTHDGWKEQYCVLVCLCLNTCCSSSLPCFNNSCFKNSVTLKMFGLTVSCLSSFLIFNPHSFPLACAQRSSLICIMKPSKEPLSIKLPKSVCLKHSWRQDLEPGWRSP